MIVQSVFQRTRPHATVYGREMKMSCHCVDGRLRSDIGKLLGGFLLSVLSPLSSPGAQGDPAAASPSPATTTAAATADAQNCPIGPGLCPELVHLPGGTFRMGDLSGAGSEVERPVHTVTVPPFWIGKYPVTFTQWDACVKDGGCPKRDAYTDDEIAGDQGWGREERPVISINAVDSAIYIGWLSNKLHVNFRRPTEAEYEYAARAGTQTDYWWGNTPDPHRANFDAQRTEPVTAFPPNPFGLYDMLGNVWEWTADCWHPNYKGAPTDGSAWVDIKDCPMVVLRGGSWSTSAAWVRASARIFNVASFRLQSYGFRVARSE
jgi:formylglycine-generating enzyme required for sulfatase activity